MEMDHAGASPLCSLKWSPTPNSNQIYFATRLTALAGVCAELVGFNLTTQFNCQGWVQAVLVRRFPYCSIPLSVGLMKRSDHLLPNVCSQFLTHPAKDVRNGSSTDDQSPYRPLICTCIVSQDRHMGAKAHYIRRSDCRLVDKRRLPSLWWVPFPADLLQCLDPKSFLRNHPCA